MGDSLINILDLDCEEGTEHLRVSEGVRLDAVPDLCKTMGRITLGDLYVRRKRLTDIARGQTSQERLEKHVKEMTTRNIKMEATLGQMKNTVKDLRDRLAGLERVKPSTADRYFPPAMPRKETTTPMARVWNKPTPQGSSQPMPRELAKPVLKNCHKVGNSPYMDIVGIGDTSPDDPVYQDEQGAWSRVKPVRVAPKAKSKPVPVAPKVNSRPVPTAPKARAKPAPPPPKEKVKRRIMPATLKGMPLLRQPMDTFAQMSTTTRVKPCVGVKCFKCTVESSCECQCKRLLEVPRLKNMEKYGKINWPVANETAQLFLKDKMQVIYVNKNNPSMHCSSDEDVNPIWTANTEPNNRCSKKN